MIGRGWSNSMIRMMCKPYCRDGYGDHDLDALIDGAREKWGVPNEEPVEPAVHRRKRRRAPQQDTCGAADRRQNPRGEVRRAG